MIVIPAIDLKEGRVVRLHQGRAERCNVYGGAPLDVAETWVGQGAEWIHVVDLDGAFTGSRAHRAIVKRLARSVDARIELGGGIRGMDDIEDALSLGVARVVLGTIARTDPTIVERAVAVYGDRIAVGIDADEGRVRIAGWRTDSGERVADAAARLERLGVSRVIYTDIARDGAMTGPNVDATLRLASATSMNVIASGGVGRLEDLVRLAAAANAGGATIEGVIVGRALYENRFTLVDAIEATRG